MAFSNEVELTAAIVAAATKAVAKVEKKVYEEFAGNLNQYYTEFIPAEYIRTGALYGSLEETGVMSNSLGASAIVRFNTPSYETGAVDLQSGRIGWATWSGGQVLDHALNRGTHGGYVSGTQVWNDSINSLGDIKGMLLAAVKEQL